MTRFVSWILDLLFRRDIFPDYVTEETFVRWLVFKFEDKRRIYIHHFYPQTDLYSHDHVRGLISFGIWGRYREETWDAEGVSQGDRIWRAPWIRHFPPTFRHKFTVDHGTTAWTVCITDAEHVENWGFWTPEGKFIHWLDRTKDEGHTRDADGNQQLDGI